MSEEFKTIVINCSCGKTFFWTAKEQEFYAKQGFAPPKRCSDCRRAKKNRYGDR